MFVLLLRSSLSGRIPDLSTMPKKMGENSKAVEARERKAATKKLTAAKAEKEKEDKLW